MDQIFTVSGGFSALINQKLKDKFLQKWKSDISNSSKEFRYRIFKTKFVKNT